MVNKEDANKILGILATADGGCPTCVASLYVQFINDFGFRELAEKKFKDLLDYDMKDWEENNY